MGRKLALGNGKFYTVTANQKTGTPPNWLPGQTLKNLTFLESVKATKSLYPDKLNHKFMERDEVVVLNGSNMFDALIAQVKAGDVVDITYRGKEPCPFGKMKGRPAHMYEVEIVKEAAIASDAVTTNTDDDDDF